jgi:hypothetical protein
MSRRSTPPAAAASAMSRASFPAKVSGKRGGYSPASIAARRRAAWAASGVAASTGRRPQRAGRARGPARSPRRAPRARQKGTHWPPASPPRQLPGPRHAKRIRVPQGPVTHAGRAGPARPRRSPATRTQLRPGCPGQARPPARVEPGHRVRYRAGHLRVPAAGEQSHANRRWPPRGEHRRVVAHQ